MNDGLSQERWKRLRVRAREERGDFSVDPLDRTEDKFEELASALQDKYGYALGKADEIIERRLREADQEQNASAIRSRRINKRQSIDW
jgi:hypothetical protein